ncbi:nucleoside phosphorylase [Lactobacillus crispatus]|uniref:Uridine phosphorylase n=1 Tax=Lactobacillus crispatus TaxID=47770 RepID=A0AAW8WQ96_9LACO|nr:nucleoside phosphorylase [Lactobacillus crispatus]MDT9610305.1 nucleoside phosphorylase [Lactobacillus crispatus]MDT9616150.1 nucleoside phosphorylase [Lactobacillus crispatus]
MNEEPFILDFDLNKKAVIEPGVENLQYNFHEKLLFAFVPDDEIKSFLDKHSHKTLGKFKTVSFRPKVYEVKINNQLITLCQAPVGASASTKFLDWLINYGVKQVLSVGNAGALDNLPENTMFVPQEAIRGEGTSFYYKEPSKIIALDKNFVRRVENEIKNLGFQYEKGTTWTTDGFFRETPNQVLQAKKLGAKTVEMECSALAACAEFRNISFAQILFTADSLADMDNYDKRNWGHDSYSVSLNIGSQVLASL